MANYINNKKSVGLKGGPNEYITHISDLFSVEGYKADSPDVNNPYNIIQSGDITMEGVDFPVMGTDNLGNRKLMTPGNNYQFPGDQVFEVPLAQTGWEVPKRKGVRLNYDKEGNVVGESTHIMRTETDGKGNWFSFPTLFQNGDGTWVDMSISLEEPWEPVYQEALKRGEVIDFGTDKEAAIKFGEGSWKKKLKNGGSLPEAQVGAFLKAAAKQVPKYINKASKYIDDAAKYIDNYLSGADTIVDDVVDDVVVTPKTTSITDTPKALPRTNAEDWTFYRNTDVNDMMEPIDFSNPNIRNGVSVPKKMSWYTPDAERFGDYGKNKYTSKINPTNPYVLDKPELWSVDRIKQIMDDGYDAIIVKNGSYASSDIRDAYEVIPLDKTIISELEKIKRMGGDIPKAQGGTFIKSVLKQLPKYADDAARYIDDGAKWLDNWLAGTTDNVVKEADEVITPSWAKGVTHYGTSPDGMENALVGMKQRGKYLDDVNYDANSLIGENVVNHGSYDGRQVVEVALPDGNTQLFYKSTGTAEKEGLGVGGTTEGLWQPFGGHLTTAKTDNWFIKDGIDPTTGKLSNQPNSPITEGYENYYDSKSFKDISGNLDRIATEQGWDMSNQILRSDLKYGGDLPEAQVGKFLTAAVKQAPKYIDDAVKYLDDGAKYVDNYFNPPKKSSADWASVNESILDNKILLQEYNLIEETAKANGTWMKNADGSAFQGTPELFIQSKSTNFQNAYPDGFQTVYRGMKSPSSNLINDVNISVVDGADSQMIKGTGVFTGDIGLAERYVGKNENSPLYQLAMRNSDNSVQIPGFGDYWTNIKNPYMKSKESLIAKVKGDLEILENKYIRDKAFGESHTFNPNSELTKATHLKQVEDEFNTGKEAVKQLEDVIKNYDDVVANKNYVELEKWWGDPSTRVGGNSAEQSLYAPGSRTVATDDLAIYLQQSGLDNIRIPNIFDGGKGDVFINNQVSGNYLKSLDGNNGMFDLSRPSQFERDGGEQLPQAQLGRFLKTAARQIPKYVDNAVEYVDDGAKYIDNYFSNVKPPPSKFTTEGLEDATYRIGSKETGTLTRSQLDDVVTNRKAWVNSDEYIKRRTKQLAKSDKFKNATNADVAKYINDDVKSMENAFDQIAVKFNKDLDSQGQNFGKRIEIKTPDGSGVGFSPNLNTYLDVFDHEVLHAFQTQAGSHNPQLLDAMYDIAKSKLAKGESIETIQKALKQKAMSMEDISRGFHKGQLHMTTPLSSELKNAPMPGYGNRFAYLSEPVEQNARHIMAIENLVSKYGYNYGKVTDDLLSKFSDDVINGQNKFGVDDLFRNLGDDSGKTLTPGSKGWNDAVRPILENAWMFPAAGVGTVLANQRDGGEQLPQAQDGRSSSITVDFNDLEKGIRHVESLNGVLMKNSQSSASGYYQDLFDNFKKNGIEYDGDRDAFIADTTFQKNLFIKRYNGDLPNVPGLKSNGEDLYNEYKDQVDFTYTPTEIAALSNMLGRGGTRKYLGNVLRDGQSLAEVFPNLYGDGRQLGKDGKPLENKTPDEYILAFNKALGKEKLGGGLSKKQWGGGSYDGGYRGGTNPYNNPFSYGVPVNPDTIDETDIVEETDITLPPPLDINWLQPPVSSIQDGINIYQPILRDQHGRDLNDLSPEELEAFYEEMRQETEQAQIDQVLIDQEYLDPNQVAGFVQHANQRGQNYERGFEDFTERSAEDVQLMQGDLLEQGYDIGPTGADGIYGRRTHEAYSSMIADAGLEESAISRYGGKYNPETYTEVKAIQTKLIDKGFLPEITEKGVNNVDGKFGERTKMALLDYNTSISEEEEDVEGLIFDTIPTTLEDERCAAGMCQILELNDVETEAIGVKYKDAWDLLESMEHVGNSAIQFNIYDDPLFNNVNENTSEEELKRLTAKAKRKHQTTASNYEVGDIVGIYWPGSDHHLETLNSDTYNTHSGFVSSIDENGTPIITHNVGGNVRNVPYDQVATAWISRPNENITLNTTYAEQYEVDDITNTQIDLRLLNNFTKKKERALTNDETAIVTNIMQRADYNSKHIPEILNSSVDQEWLNAAIFGITGVESGAGISKNPPPPRTFDDIERIKRLKYTIDKTSENDISLGIGKTKYSALDNFARKYFEINSPADLADDNKAVDAVSYILVKNYELFKDYAQQYPTLGLAEEDIRNMALLSYNQGESRLLQTGRSATNDRSSVEEVAELRKLYYGTMDGYDASNYRHLPDVDIFGMDIIDGQSVYNGAVGIGLEGPSERYVSKTNRYITEVYGGTDLDNDRLLALNTSSNNGVPVLAKGGEYGVFQNYVNGDYNNTPREKYAEKVFDKLNRKHYKKAKTLGMSPSNYIMSNFMGQA